MDTQNVLPDLSVQALERTAYPPRAGEKIDWSKPLFDSDGYEHVIVELGSTEVVTKQYFVYVPWVRKTGECRREGCDGLSLSNTPLSQEELDRRRAVGAAILDDLHAKAYDNARAADRPRN